MSGAEKPVKAASSSTSTDDERQCASSQHSADSEGTKVETNEDALSQSPRGTTTDGNKSKASKDLEQLNSAAVGEGIEIRPTKVLERTFGDPGTSKEFQIKFVDFTDKSPKMKFSDEDKTKVKKMVKAMWPAETGFKPGIGVVPHPKEKAYLAQMSKMLLLNAKPQIIIKWIGTGRSVQYQACLVLKDGKPPYKKGKKQDDLERALQALYNQVAPEVFRVENKYARVKSKPK
ncbi:hypothetical protein N0V83_003494 [Neocucurbitaria cava]|uniref:Uncharacterized protein n=1 Tax=Neocucurbitaria cava TaxID=798079 RepID=A0A9W9CPC6_9PLEO|nr:hypothetical protein N0V83_003494 [Neocucurbitaria cava]